MVDLIKPVTGKAGKYIWYDARYCLYCIVCKKHVSVLHKYRGKKHGSMVRARHHAKCHEEGKVHAPGDV